MAVRAVISIEGHAVDPQNVDALYVNTRITVLGPDLGTLSDRTYFLAIGSVSLLLAGGFDSTIADAVKADLLAHEVPFDALDTVYRI